ncbi:helix-turn-helix domain-containing protein [Candidatus Acetothermia bacterium]|jgi:UTP-glucose-1-phosphate uridylyltransferase/DNA-binding XRE family transcriptional regulator|nr:helix-turn-helix domain-containing protein [Candidatus Acetothermia bacterium]MCI2432489.1 helix-turn-helix domain-containing protein [Candidatus Acetothermia bacterium]MCI2436329.1 helix-turn-helix domain-containing protein [Candidatus Acetothermia bacterium]
MKHLLLTISLKKCIFLAGVFQLLMEDLQALGKLLREYRERAQLTRAQLARRARISASFVTYLEKGHRRPSAAIIARIAQALGLRADQQKQLLQSAGYASVEEIAQVSGLQGVLDEIAALSSQERDELITEIHRLLGRWQELRAKRLRKVVIPVAGWQPRLLSPAQLGQMLRPALEEIATAGLKEAILVLAPSRPAPQIALPKNLKLRQIVQEPQLGLGHAILIAQGLVGDEPFAILLPDDIILADRARSLCQMIKIYERHHCSILAVTEAEEAADFKNYGIATLGQRLEEELYWVEALAEKPRGREREREGLTIVGRYIVTPQIFEALQATAPDPNGELQLTDALNLLLQRQRICAYRYEGQLFRVTPIKMLLESLIEALDDQQPGRLERAMAITKNALYKLGRLRG